MVAGVVKTTTSRSCSLRSKLAGLSSKVAATAGVKEASRGRRAVR